MITIGIDNGSTGSIGVLGGRTIVGFAEVPTRESLHYGRSKSGTTLRLDRTKFRDLFQVWTGGDRAGVRVFIERPFTGKFINAILPAHRFFEATICTLEDLGLGFQVIDSRDWQSQFWGKGIKGSANLKRASLLRGIELYPQLADAIKHHGDADGLLIAHRFHFFSSRQPDTPSTTNTCSDAQSTSKSASRTSNGPDRTGSPH